MGRLRLYLDVPHREMKKSSGANREDGGVKRWPGSNRRTKNKENAAHQPKRPRAAWRSGDWNSIPLAVTAEGINGRQDVAVSAAECFSVIRLEGWHRARGTGSTLHIQGIDTGWTDCSRQSQQPPRIGGSDWQAYSSLPRAKRVWRRLITTLGPTFM
ncbi:hypothetical protein SKAU_G00125200 [Synaphobranchus kaupii]|uniref:Uncharacterized protein n=1 Tax=Synaphobranchus kaupii TaxID=118154 RepID=A0A9Q1FPP9_SYNKA|nr:hypothetical protein SKAU_G00125200 [Synaphobranchus kaupii]